jgi:DNA-binding NtrC family response regulator
MTLQKILIIDDNPEIRSSLSQILRARGYHTDTASSGEEALEKAASGEFNVALLDLIMPDMNGLDVLLEFRKIQPATKIIMITGFATIDTAVRAMKKGASDYISKPFQMEDLEATIKRVLEESRFDRDAKKLDLDYTFGSLSNPIRRKIIKLLFQNKSMHLMAITKDLGIEDHTKVVFHLRTLKETGIIEKNKKKAYSLTREGKKILNSLKILETHL